MPKKAPRLGDETVDEPTEPVVHEPEPTLEEAPPDLAEAKATLAKAQADLAEAQAAHAAAVEAAKPKVEAFDASKPTLVLEDGRIIDAPAGTGPRDQTVVVGGHVYHHVSDHGPTGRWVYRMHER